MRGIERTCWKRWMLMMMLIVAACSSVGPKQYITAGQLLLRTEAEKALQEEIGFWFSEWDEGSNVVGELDDERFPDWARDSYAACIHWKETFQRETINSNRQQGEPLQTIVTGSAEGWILMKESLDWHILELRVAYEDEEFLWIEAWDAPPDST
ncbi:hypothetical protein ACFLSZ_01805 [Candidatus Bipolaricaulota bacterium]